MTSKKRTGKTRPDALHKNHAAYFVPGLRRGLMVMEAIAEEGSPLSIADIAERVSLTRSSVFRLVYTLRHMGFLEAVGDGKVFRLGPRVLNIGFAYLASKDIIDISRSDLEQLRDETNVSSHLAIRDGREVLYLNCVQTRSGFLSNMNVGARLPAYVTPLGWFLLSNLSHREIANLFANSTLKALTPKTPTSVKTLNARIAEAVANGFIISRGIVGKGGSSVTAPVFNKAGEVVAAVDISGPDSAFDLDAIETRYVEAVVKTALRISRRLGYAPHK